MNRQMVLDVLNSLEVIETNGGDDAYILVDNTEENRKRLNDVGIKNDEIYATGDENEFCILALAFNGKYADDFENGKLVAWGPIDDTLRYRVLNGEGTPSDAERLLKALEPEYLISLRPEVQWFAAQMELALKENDHKTGWKDCSKDWLVEQMYRHAVKLWNGEIELKYAVNVANFAMMIADNARGENDEKS